MGIISRLPRPKASSWGPTDDRWYYPGGSFYGGINPTSSGVAVSSDTAMRLITVQNCIRMRAATIARLPCHVMEQNGKIKQKATNFSLYRLLHDRPNSWMTSPEFWAMVEAHVCLRGNFYAYKLGIEGRPVLGLIPIGPDRIYEIVQNSDYSLTYRVRVGTDYKVTTQGYGSDSGGEIKDIPGQKIMHIRGLTLDGVIGANPIEYARETIGLGIASVQFLSQYFGKGMHPSAVIKHPLNLNAPAHANLRKNLREKYQGLGKFHEFMLIDEGMDITFPTIKLVDAQYLEQMKLSDAQICGLFRVPLMLVNGGDKEPTYASAEQFMLFYQMFSIDVSLYEAAINRDLMSIEEQKKYYAKFELRALQRGSFKEQMEGFGTAIDKEILNPNEVRDLLDMNPYEGGDEYRTRTSTVKDTGKQDKEITKEPKK